jgi:hypothetical protein
MGKGITPIFDTEVERVKEQLAQADALRKMGLEGNTGSGYQGGRVFVVGNPLGNIASGLAGAFLGDRARTRQGELEQQQTTARDEWLGQMPSGTDTQHYDPVANPGTGPLAEGMEVPQSPLQQAKAMQSWAMKAPRGMEGVQNFALQQSLTAPQREAEAAQKAQDRLHELQLKAIDARATQAERLAAQKEIAQMQIEGRKETARLVASLKAVGGSSGNKPDMRLVDTVDDEGNPVKKVVDMNAVKPGDTFGKPAKAPTKAEEALKKAMAAPGQIDQIMKEAESNKEAFGIIPAATTMLPNIVGSRLMSKVLTPDQQKARVKVQTQAAKVIHDVYGAALSRNEAFRAEGWAPDPRDDYESTMRKLQGAKEYAQMLSGKNGGSPAAPTGGISDDDLLKKYGSGK